MDGVIDSYLMALATGYPRDRCDGWMTHLDLGNVTFFRP
jgi:hypothetical protein